MTDDDKCPHCHVNWQGPEIPKASLAKGYFGEWDGVTPKYFTRRIGIEIRGLYDGTAYYQCPDCHGEWPREGREDLWDATH